jgi:23S rRNA pseudouridine1911/1915/1917 synthase
VTGDDDGADDEAEDWTAEPETAAPGWWAERHGGHPPWLDDAGRPRIVERRIEVEPDFEGWRLDLYLRRVIPRLSRTRLQAIIRDWTTAADGRRLKAHSPVRAGEVLTVRRHARPEPPYPREFTVLHDEPELLVVDKPANLPVHASARYYYGTLMRLLDERFPGQGLQICHRLDRETSGCMVIARGKDAARSLKTAFAERRVHKTYLALVHGEPSWDEQRCQLPLRLVPRSASELGVRMEICPGAPDGLPSETEFRVLDRGRDVALVECKPLTGRQHQIRVHLLALGHPIVGDKLYAHGDAAFRRYCARAETLTDEQVAAEFGLPRHALHAARVIFPHPSAHRHVDVCAPCPVDMAIYLTDRK